MYKKAALAILLLQGINAINIRESSVAKHAFIKKMRDANKAKGTSRRMNWNKLTEKSVHKPGLRSKSEPSNDSKHSNPEASQENEEQLDRKLSWWNWNSNAAEGEGMANATDQNNDGSWFSWNWNNTQDDDDMWVRQGQNVSYVMNGLKDFSIKYAGCSSLTSYASPGDEEDASFPFVNSNYVSYRLCPTESCKDDSWRGCKQVYGEYMMDLEEFLAAQQSYVEEEFEAYCNYCENCMYFDKWYSGWNHTSYNYDEQVHGCDLYEECEDYAQVCDQQYHEEQEKELGYNYEDFLECTEVEVDLSYYGVAETDMSSQVQENMGDYGYDQDGEYNMQKAYIGPHCDEGVIGIGLFMDEFCTQYVGNKFDLFNATGYEAEADVIDDVYVPQGCHSCAGENVSCSWYFVLSYLPNIL